MKFRNVKIGYWTTLWIEESSIPALIEALEHSVKEDGNPLEYTISESKSQAEIIQEHTSAKIKTLKEDLERAKDNAAL